MLKAVEKEWPVTVNVDMAVDLAEEAGMEGGWKKVVGIILILAINLVGIAVIVRIWRKG